MLRRTVALLVLLAVAVYLTPRSPTRTAEAVTTVPFLYTGSEQTFSVPAGVTQVHIVAIGAKGGDFSFGDALHVSNLSASITNTTGTPGNGGLGAKVVTDIPVPSGVTKFFVEVGGTGANADSIGTFNGGAPGGSGNFGFAPSGGGASDVRTVSNAIGGSVNSRLVVAGGGGGGGVPTDGPQGGGGGDAGNPASAGSDATSGGAGKGGGPGTLISGGSGGAGGIGGGVADGSSALITSFGGAGGGAGQSSGAGGGGGGGYFGGGGGGGGSNGNGAGGGGGAGSSFITGTALPGGTIVTAAPVDVTSVTISYVLAPTVSKAFAVSPILVGATTDLTFSIANPNPADVLSAVGMTDSLPANILIAQTGATSVSASCGVPTITATINTSLVTLANATIPANSTCTFTVKVIGVTPGTLTNTTSFVSSSSGSSPNQASAPITVQAPDTPTPTPSSTPSPTPTSTASPTPTSTASPTPTSTASPTPTPTATATPTPPSFVSPVESSPTPTPTATATPVFFPQLALPTVSVPTFQNPAAGGLFNAPPKTPTPGGPSLSQSSFAGGGGHDLRLQAASVGQPSGVPVIRPPSTGNAGLEPEP